MLFDEFALAGLALRNRIVRSATYMQMADEDGRVTERLLECYAGLAAGGSGLIITGNALVHPSGRSSARMLSIHGETFIDGLRSLADAVHGSGGVIAVQLVHGGRQCMPVLLGGQPLLAPSEVPVRLFRATPKAMTDGEIWTVVEAFADAAWRARSAGFDAVQIHAAHGYLISSFLSHYTNLRDDYWGGDELRRTHFLEEVLKAVRKSVGSDYPVLIKINSDDLLPAGLHAPESLGHVKRVLQHGLDAVEISGGIMDAPIRTIRPGTRTEEDEAYYRDAGRLFRENLPIPVILTGGMRSRRVMEDVLRRGEADLIGMSRPLIREPDLPNLLRRGQERASCISCNKCTRFRRLPYVYCRQLEDELKDAAGPKEPAA